MSAKKINCIDDNAYIAAAKQQAQQLAREGYTELGLQVAMYLAERTIFSDINDMKKELGDRRLAMARAVVAHQDYARGREQVFVSETMAAPRYTPMYGTALIAAGTTDEVSTRARERIDAEALRMGADRLVTVCFENRMLRNFALAKTDVTAYLMRTEEARANKQDERRVSRQLSVIGLGKGVLQDAIRIGQVGEAANEIVQTTLMNTMTAFSAGFSAIQQRWRSSPGYEAGVTTAPRVTRPGESMVEFSGANGQTTSVVMSDSAADNALINANKMYKDSNVTDASNDPTGAQPYTGPAPEATLKVGS